MEDSEPPRKRLRHSDGNGNEDATVSTVLPLTRSPDFWFKDGTIIIQAETTQFRVHGGMLARHSTVFRDMFEIPQPTHGEPVVEGCLVVHVSDSSTDIAHMLSSLYDKTRDKDLGIPSFAEVSAMLRLGKKYEIDYQYHNALDRLQSEFPSTLPEWESQRTTTYVKYKAQNIFDAVNLALETNTLSILPAAYLVLAMRGTNIIIDGYPTTGAMIPPDAQLACIRGRERILEAMSSESYSWVLTHDEPLSGDQCCSPEACMNVSHYCASELWELRSYIQFAFWTKGTFLESFGSFCEKCEGIARDQQAEGALKMWKKLPEYFGLPPWEEILR